MSSVKDLNVLEHILEYCVNIQEIHKEFGQNKSKYKNSKIYKNAIAFALLQIGELAGKLSDEYKSIHSEIPWALIRGLRNRIVHGYEDTSPARLWDTSIDDIQRLLQFCKTALEGNSND